MRLACFTGKVASWPVCEFMILSLHIWSFPSEIWKLSLLYSLVGGRSWPALWGLSLWVSLIPHCRPEGHCPLLCLSRGGGSPPSRLHR